MLQIMIACRRTGQFVPAGIETDIDTFIALPEALRFRYDDLSNDLEPSTPILSGLHHCYARI
jgi:hypothetical protein